jgi:hypothetical protein
METSNLQKKVYESKKARDILDEEFIEFAPKKRNINEFFDIYRTKFYNIIEAIHSFFSEKSLQYVIDYINPKELQKIELERQKEQIQIDIDSIEKFHPLFENGRVLKNGSRYFLIQSGKKRRIRGNGTVEKVKALQRQTNKIDKNWAITVPTSTVNGITSGPDIHETEDVATTTYTINTGQELPSNIY